jgi:hypothetical protein
MRGYNSRDECRETQDQRQPEGPTVTAEATRAFSRVSGHEQERAEAIRRLAEEHRETLRRLGESR